MAIVLLTVRCFVVVQKATHLIKEKNYLDAVIGMPANIFYNEYPDLFLVLKKSEPLNIFIDASQHLKR
jgi:type I restriction enzyme M protein